ncbi:MAG: Lrp/AsnC family transcriptional regulator [Actinomycetota bacterium]
METSAIDVVDTRIIELLRSAGRMSWRAIADRVHLAPSSVADRVRRLEELGVITGYTAVIDPVALGRSIRAIVDVSLVPGDHADAFEHRLVDRDEVVMAAYVTGASDYTIVAECHGTDGLDAFVRWVRADPAVSSTESRLLLRSLVG